jgi:5'-phosphate synthase pdxT subunit
LFHAVFIRAPRLAQPGPQVAIVARRLPEAGGEPVGVRQGRVVGLCFHPELTSDTRFHRWFLAEVAQLEGLRSAAAPERQRLAATVARESS